LASLVAPRGRSGRAALLLGLGLGAAGCEGSMVGQRIAAEDPALRAFEEDVQPILAGFCAACHAHHVDIAFLAPDPDVRTSMLAWEGPVDLVEPTRSGLITRGSHTGPALTPAQSAVILDWITLEAEVSGAEPAKQLATLPITPVDGTNEIPLDSLGLAGAAVTFL